MLLHFKCIALKLSLIRSLYVYIMPFQPPPLPLRQVSICFCFFFLMSFSQIIIIVLIVFSLTSNHIQKYTVCMHRVAIMSIVHLLCHTMSLFHRLCIIRLSFLFFNAFFLFGLNCCSVRFSHIPSIRSSPYMHWYCEFTFIVRRDDSL